MPSPNPYPPPGPPKSALPPETELSGMEVAIARRELTEGVAYVYAPIRPDGGTKEGGLQEVQFELRRLADGTAGLPIFTAPDLLVAQLGEFQPWVKIAVLELLLQVTTANVPVVLNPVVRDGADRWTAAGLDSWQRENR